MSGSNPSSKRFEGIHPPPLGKGQDGTGIYSAEVSAVFVSVSFEHCFRKDLSGEAVLKVASRCITDSRQGFPPRWTNAAKKLKITRKEKKELVSRKRAALLDNQKNPEEKEREDNPTSNYQAGNEKHLFTSKKMPFDQQEPEFGLKGRRNNQVGQNDLGAGGRRRQETPESNTNSKTFSFFSFCASVLKGCESNKNTQQMIE